MVKKTKRAHPARTPQVVSTNFKQNHRRKPASSAGGTRSRSGGGGGAPGRATGDFDPDQNVRQVGSDMTEAPAAVPAAAPAPAMPASEPPGDQFAGRSIPRYPDETV